MAKIIFLDGSEIRGKVGGKVYSRNASGAFVRQYVKPVNANTTLQQAVRNNFASLSAAYRSLSDAARATYESMKSFYKTTDSVGNVVTPTAPQLFNRLNGVLIQNGILNSSNPLTVCPAPVALVGIASAAPTADVSATEMFANVTFTDSKTEVPADQKLIVSATSGISAGIKKVPANLYSRVFTIDTLDDTLTENIWTHYLAVFGTPVAGSSVYLKFQTFSTITGQITSEFTVPVPISA